MKRKIIGNKRSAEEQLDSALEKRLELLNEILELTKQQPSLINNEEDTEGLLENIKKRQILIDRLEELQGTEQKDAEQKHPEQKEKIQRLLSDIARQDKINEDIALKRMEQMKEKMMKIKQGRIAYNRYENPTFDYGATYFDKRK